MNTISSPHDKYFRQIFSGKAEITDLILNGLPAVAKHLDLKTLELDNTSYIDKRLGTNYSDLVYNCVYKNQLTIKIALLFEHKSNIVAIPQLQLLGYMLKIWETNIKQNQKLMPVIPILFYHGKEEFEKKPFLDHFEGQDEFLQNYLPSFDYEVINTHGFTDEQINQVFNLATVKISMLVMKHIFDEPVLLLNELNKLFEGLNHLLKTESGRDIFETTTIYLLNATKLEYKQVKEQIELISEDAVEIFETGAMKLIKKGKIEGKMEGIKEGIKEGIEKKNELVVLNAGKLGLPDDAIMKLTGLSLKEIERIRKRA